jgi:hypothetical protein
LLQEKQLEIGDLQMKLEAAEKTVDDLKMKQKYISRFTISNKY